MRDTPNTRTASAAGARSRSRGCQARGAALAEAGKALSSKDLAAKLRRWSERGAPVALLLGGPDGIGDEALARAAERWSLSQLTLPHGLARVVVAEALY